MTPQELRASIIQQAIQGKLVEQRPEEGTGEELFQQIQTKKQALIKAGVIKKEKPLPEITEDEIPFDIPDTWKWIRLSDVGQLKNGYPFKSTEYTSTGIQVVRISDLGEDAILSNDAVYYPLKDDQSPYIIENNSILICMTGSIGKMAWVRDGVLRYLNQRVGMFVPSSICCSAYLWYFLHAAHVINGWIRAKTSTNGNIKTSDITELVVPFSPLAEQERIVAKLEEILLLIDRYEAAWNKLEKFNKCFPGNMQKSILQAAIQGKLVEQRPEEGTGEELFQQIQTEKQRLIKAGKIKKEKPLPEIAEEEIPFDIPETWKWVRLQDIISVLGDGIHGTPIFDEAGDYYFVNGNNLAKGKFVFKADTKKVSIDEYEKHKKPLDANTILISINGTIGNYAFYAGEPIILGKSACYFSVLTGIDKEYVRHLINTKFFMDYAVKEATQTTIKNVSLKAMRMFPVPLPPVAEQKRIVAKLEEILPLCERLK